MEVKHLLWLHLCVSFCLIKYTVTTKLTGVGGTVVTDDGQKTCETKIHSCSIKLDNIGLARLPGEIGVPGPPGPTGPGGLKGEKGLPGLPGDKGPKGDKGTDGPRGVNGTKGETGDKGPPGLTGPEGLKGEKGTDGSKGVNGTKGETGDKGPPGPTGPEGSKGEKGTDGPKGVNGTKGETGDKGPPGPTGSGGLKGEMGPPGPMGPRGLTGEKGLPGIKGDVGAPGLSGRDGSCSCLKPEDSYDGEEGVAGTETKPLFSCKFAGKGTETGEYWVNNENPFKVKCDMDKNMTCLLIRDRTTKSTIERESIAHKNNPFWMSEMDFDLKKYYGVTTKQLEWLQKESPLMTQEIIYHCKNSYIVPKGDKSIEEALHILSWKDKVIGPRPSNSSPYFYSILTEDNGCEDSGEHKTEWRHSTIKLRSRSNGLPILDFHIRDIRVGEEQKLYIELKELCFNY